MNTLATRNLTPTGSNRTKCPSNAGYSLLEMLVYIVVFAAAVNLLISLLSTGSRLAATTTLSLNRMDGLREVQDTFTQYTRRAAAVEARVGDFETTSDRVVLRMPPGLASELDYVVLGRLHDPERFGVLGLSKQDAVLEQVYLKTFSQPLEQLHFEVDKTGARPALALELQIKLEEGERERPFIRHRCIAVPRGIGP